MDRKRIAFMVFILALAVTGCERKRDDSTGGGRWPGSCDRTSPRTYSGPTVAGSCAAGITPPCATRYMHVDVEANVIDHEKDSIDVKVYKGDGTYKTTPSPTILYERNRVTLVNAFEDGYVSYEITTTMCR